MKNIALAGNPNSGKSTLFNALTGSTQFVGNWPGVTVEKKEGKTKINNEHVRVMDLPGIYSLSPYSNEEIISRDYILDEHPDVVIDIVDASNLERNLYLTTQLIEIGVPVVVALNMMDVVEKKGEKLSSKTLSKELGCPVCEISAISNKGINELKATVGEILFLDKKSAPKHSFKHSDEIEKAVSEIEEVYSSEAAEEDNAHFIALKLLGNDQNIMEGSIIIGRWLFFLITGITLRSSVFLVYCSKVRIPRSHKITCSFPPARMYSADISHSSIVFASPLFNKTGFLIFPNSFKRSKFCIFLAPTCIKSTFSTNSSILSTLIISETMGSPVRFRASTSAMIPSFPRP